MFAELKIDTLSKPDVLAVAINGVIPKGGREIVNVEDAANRARELEIKTGIKSDE